MAPRQQFRRVEVTPAYWQVTFDNPPVNLMDIDTVEQLACLVDDIEAAPALTVVTFGTANPDFFMAHWDFTADKARTRALAAGPTGLHPFLDNLVRLSRAPVVSITALRGRARGAGSEFALATDIRFASDTAVLGQFEVGVGAVPGGGAMARLARLAGRGRALEIVLGGEDVPAARAAEYGYVNRVVADRDLDRTVEDFARRIASFDKDAVSTIKGFVDGPTLPAQGELAAGMAAFFTSTAKPENAARIQPLWDAGLQQPGGVERDLGRHLAGGR